MRVRDRALAWVMLCSALPACQGVSRSSVGPDGGLVATDDDVLTIVIQPGALGEWVDIEIERSSEPPPSFAPAYKVTPNLPLAVYSEVIYRHELPDDPSTAAVGAIHLADFAGGEADWIALPLEPGGLLVDEETVHARDNELALYYTLLGDGGVAETGSESNSETLTTSMTDPDTGTDTGPPVSFAADVQPIFTARCIDAPCHDADAPSNFLDLTDSSYDRIVGVGATGASFTLVVSGDPDTSYLFNKIVPDLPPGAPGGPMPLTGGALTAEQIETVGNWIAQGCPP